MSQVESQTAKQKLKLPNKFEVLLLNDDYTSMDFVVDVLRRFFHKEFWQLKQLCLKYTLMAKQFVAHIHMM